LIWPKLDEIELTEAILFAAPKVAFLAIAALFTTASFMFIRRNKFPTGWRQKATFGLGLCLAPPAAISIMIAFSSLTSTNKPHFFVSPDHKHVADLKYEAGFLGRDVTGLTVRSSNSFHGEDAYLYFGPSSWEDTIVRWQDNNNLVIEYYPDSGGRKQECRTAAVGISISCRPLAAR
jgi:hypothetical protein